MNATVRWPTALAIVAVMAAAGCADAEGDAAADAAEVTVEADEFSFDPTELSVPVDQDVAVTLENAGSAPHEFVVLEEGTTIGSESEFSEDLVEFEVESGAGESATATMSLSAGTYQYICAIPGHFASGMEGVLTVGD